MRAVFITDEDQFTDSKKAEYNLDSLIANNYEKLNALRDGINDGVVNGHVNNMNAMRNGQTGIMVSSCKKTLEYQICKANVQAGKNDTKGTWLYELLKRENPDCIAKVEDYMSTLAECNMSEGEQQNVALLMWKCLPGKAGFAQCLNSFLLDKIDTEGDVKFTVPMYIQDAINHLIP